MSMRLRPNLAVPRCLVRLRLPTLCFQGLRRLPQQHPFPAHPFPGPPSPQRPNLTPGAPIAPRPQAGSRYRRSPAGPARSASSCGSVGAVAAAAKNAFSDTRRTSSCAPAAAFGSNTRSADFPSYSAWSASVPRSGRTSAQSAVPPSRPAAHAPDVATAPRIGGTPSNRAAAAPPG